MDDLFRRAAENYPLNTGKGDWEKIDKKLVVVPVREQSTNPAKTFNSKKFLLLLLLFISLVVSVMVLKHFQNKLQATDATGREKQQAVTNKYKVKEKSGDSKIHQNFSAKDGKIPGLAEKKIKEFKSAEDKHAFNIRTATKENKLRFSKEDQNFVYSKTEETEVENKQGDELLIIQKPIDVPKEITEGIFENKSLIVIKRNKSKSAEVANQNHFYAGVITDIDFSKVKSTRFEGPAFGVGAFGGYQINKHLFLETGLVIFHKNYHSLGNAFYEKGVAMPSGMVINDLESRTKILEIPVKAGFDFYDRKKIQYFITIGASAYIMMNERNSYNVTMNGAPEKMEGVYLKTNTKIPAVINISTGLKRTTLGSVKIIIEPYLKLPLQGIGVGKLPVTSAGIQIGISKNLK